MASVNGKKSIKLAGWSGTPEQLQQLVDRVDLAIRSFREDAIGAHEAEDEAKGLKVSPEWVELIRSGLTPAVTLSQQRWNLEHAGAIAEIMESDEIDVRSVYAARIEVGDRYRGPGVHIALGGNGSSVDLIGPPVWLRATASEVSDMVARCSPWWLRLRSVPAAAAAGIIMVTLIALGLAGGTTMRFTNRDGSGVSRVSAWSSYLVIAVSPTFIAAWIYLAIIKRILPGFEITTPEHPSRGRRVIGVAATLALGVIASVIANRLG